MVSRIQDRIETDIANLLLQKLEDNQITPERASEISHFILTSLPEDMTEEQVLHILPTLDDTFLELAGVVNSYLHEYKEAEKKHIEAEAILLLKKGKLDQANKLMKNYFLSK